MPMANNAEASNRRKDEVFLAGYTDKMSGRPGDTIQFHVSCQESNLTIHTRLVRSICADPNPKGPGIIEEDASEWFPSREFQGRHQLIPCGSYASTRESISFLDAEPVFAVDIWVYPTLLESTLFERQCIWTLGDDFGLFMNKQGKLQLGDLIFQSHALSLRKWVHVSLVMNRSDHSVQINIKDVHDRVLCDETHPSPFQSNFSPGGKFCLAPQGTWNGKLEHPRILGKMKSILLEWKTWDNMAGRIIRAKDQDGWIKNLDLVLHHQPTRGMTGHHWDGSEHCWKHKHHHYGAIYFHEDDGYDFEWKPDLKWTIPEGTPSGIYILHLTAKEEASGTIHRESLPIFVCAKKPSAKVCVLVSTFTYVMYGNHGRSDFDEEAFKRKREAWKSVYPYNALGHPSYRQSTYNFHSDGSGIHYASHRRPLFTIRPGYISLPHTCCSGLRHFQADSHLIAFLHSRIQSYRLKGNDGPSPFDYDIITDHELHTEGYACLEGYTTLMTGSHPEYHTLGSLTAIEQFRDKLNGNIIYLGGNGFYWRIGASNCKPTRSDPDPIGAEDVEESLHLLEIRRAEDGVRTWASEPGEYYHSLERACSYGGLWRRNGRPPQKLVGIGFASQGSFQGMPYRRNLSLDPSLNWILDGIPADKATLGEFGLSGGGAAGFELDRVDRNLDEFESSRFSVPLTVIAQAHGKGPGFILVPEEVLTTYSNTAGLTEAEAKRADMIYFRLKRTLPDGSQSEEGGSQVFSVGSITFCGCLPHNKFENEIATILGNVLTRFSSDN